MLYNFCYWLENDEQQNLKYDVIPNYYYYKLTFAVEINICSSNTTSTTTTTTNTLLLLLLNFC